MRWRSTGAAAGIGVVLAVAGCTSDPPTVEGVIGTPTPTPTPTPTVSTPPEIPVRAFPTTCGDLVAASEVLAAIGRDQLAGTSSRVYAGPVDGGSRERLTCGYGVYRSRGAAEPEARVTVSTLRYTSVAQAAARVEATAAEAQGEGKRVTPQPVAGQDAVLVRDGDGSYLALAVRDRTYVVEVSEQLVRPAAAPAVLVALAESALGVPPAGTGAG